MSILIKCSDSREHLHGFEEKRSGKREMHAQMKHLLASQSLADLTEILLVGLLLECNEIAGNIAGEIGGPGNDGRVVLSNTARIKSHENQNLGAKISRERDCDLHGQERTECTSRWKWQPRSQKWAQTQSIPKLRCSGDQRARSNAASSTARSKKPCELFLQTRRHQNPKHTVKM
jgi:hypothetical protein